jgi:hypothetical protein
MICKAISNVVSITIKPSLDEVERVVPNEFPEADMFLIVEMYSWDLGSLQKAARGLRISEVIIPRMLGLKVITQ